MGKVNCSKCFNNYEVSEDMVNMYPKICPDCKSVKVIKDNISSIPDIDTDEPNVENEPKEYIEKVKKTIKNFFKKWTWKFRRYAVGLSEQLSFIQKLLISVVLLIIAFLPILLDLSYTPENNLFTGVLLIPALIFIFYLFPKK